MPDFPYVDCVAPQTAALPEATASSTWTQCPRHILYAGHVQRVPPLTVDNMCHLKAVQDSPQNNPRNSCQPRGFTPPKPLLSPQDADCPGTPDTLNLDANFICEQDSVEHDL